MPTFEVEMSYTLTNKRLGDRRVRSVTTTVDAINEREATINAMIIESLRPPSAISRGVELWTFSSIVVTQIR